MTDADLQSSPPSEIERDESRFSAGSWTWSWAGVAAVALAIPLVLAQFWMSGWLLTLDWAPGPGLVTPSLPSGPLLDISMRSLALLDRQSAGWGPIALAIVGAFLGGAYFASRVRVGADKHLSTAACCAAGCVAAVAPFMVLRAYSGQVGVLLGAAALWWFFASLAGSSDRADVRSTIWPVIWASVAATCALHYAMVVVVAAGAFAVIQTRRVSRRAALARLGTTVLGFSVLTALWAVPMLIDEGQSLGEPGGSAAVVAFSSDGSIPSVAAASMVGATFWRPVPAEILVVPVLFALGGLIALAACWNLGAGWSHDDRHFSVLLLALGVVAAFIGRGPTAGAWAWAIDAVPGLGIVREPSKFAVLVGPAVALGIALGVERLRDTAPGRFITRRVRAAQLMSGVCVVAMLGALSMLGNSLAPSEYPREWWQAREVVRANDCPVAVVGDGAYTDPGFTDGRIVANPAIGFLGPQAVASQDPEVAGLEVPHPESRAQLWVNGLSRARWGEGLDSLTADRAAAAGVGWVFVPRPVDRPELAHALDEAGFRPAVVTDAVGLWQVGRGCR